MVWLLWRTHFAVGLLSGTGLATLLHGDPLVFTGAAGLASLLPDIDSPRSFLGRKVLPVSVTLDATVGHRGFLHSVMGLVVFCAALGFALRSWPGFVYGVLPAVAVGYLSHLLLDALNPGGVPLLWPSKKRFSLRVCRVGSLAERILSIPLLLVAGYVILKVVVIRL